MGVDQLTFSFPVIQWLIMLMVGLYTWYVGRQSASARDLLDLRERIIRLESDMKNVPSQAALHELMSRLERVDSALQHTSASLEAMTMNLERINSYLLNNK